MRRLTIFAHFDAQSAVKRYVFHHLAALRATCESVVFVSNSAIDAASYEKLQACCDDVIVRENTGYDFSMWQHALARVDSSEWDELVLTNSSVFGPVCPLDGAFSRMRASSADFWGMTESTEFASHLQSYFLVFRKGALVSKAFADFWKSVLPYRDKYQTIRSYEIGLTTYLTEQGLRPDCLIPLGVAKPRWPRKKRYDPTLTRPTELLGAGMPYVKVALLRSNPLGVRLKAVYAAMEGAGYDRSLVEFDRPPAPLDAGSR